MKTILVPTDFSIPSDNAIHYALKLAKLFDASLVLYHAFIPFETGFYPLKQSIIENLETENAIINRLLTIKTEVSKIYKNVPITIHVDRGPESTSLIAFCKKNKPDIIVLGTSGASGLKEIILGSFAADVMSKASCPVLAIPMNAKFKIPKKITFASDYHRKDFLSINFLCDWVLLFKTKITILHIDDIDYLHLGLEKKFLKYKQKMEQKYPDIPITFQHVEGVGISKTILELTSKDKTDILVISPIKREGIWDRLFHKSVTKTTAHKINIPLLTLPIK